MGMLDVIGAKRALSARLLGPALARGVVGRSMTTDVNVAAAASGHNVHAVGVGRKIVAGRLTDTLAVRLYVVQKLAASAIPARNVLPTEFEGVPIDIVEAAPAFATCTADRRRRRPVTAGISVAPVGVTAGTIGYFCRSLDTTDSPNDVFVLGNNHILANVNRAATGDAILQPGPADGGTAADRIAQLHRFVVLNLDGVSENRIDAAIGRLDQGLEHTIVSCSIGEVSGTDVAAEEMRVSKHGRTTGFTEGIIDDISLDPLVGMDRNDPSLVAKFVDQIRIRRAGSSAAFAMDGDSGSIVVASESRRAIGLYFAGPSDGSYGVANPIADVLSQLNIELIV